jgi:hypothetical protein
LLQQTANYTTLASDETILVDATAGNNNYCIGCVRVTPGKSLQ